MAWCLIKKAHGQLYLYFTYIPPEGPRPAYQHTLLRVMMLQMCVGMPGVGKVQFVCISHELQGVQFCVSAYSFPFVYEEKYPSFI
jgi:hypothetical protein